LGTFLLVSSVVLIGISVPSAFREALAAGGVLNEANRQRVSTLLARTGLDQEQCARLTTPDALRQGHRLVRQECIDCHDLRTVLARPRTPENWRQTVRRMADRAMMLNPLEEEEQLLVTAYLVALSPGLQKSTQQLRQEQDRRDQSKRAAAAVAAEETSAVAYDPVAAQQLVETKCSQCHATDILELAPPANEQEAHALVTRMIDEGLEVTEEEINQIVRCLVEKYGKSVE
jgi:mono/diheme cytochrome c family protein